jgi:hypothetical protein
MMNRIIKICGWTSVINVVVLIISLNLPIQEFIKNVMLGVSIGVSLMGSIIFFATHEIKPARSLAPAKPVPPVPPMFDNSIRAKTALQISYLSWHELMRAIRDKAIKHENCLPYVMVSPVHIERLKQLGYKVSEKLMDGSKTTIKW